MTHKFIFKFSAVICIVFGTIQILTSLLPFVGTMLIISEEHFIVKLFWVFLIAVSVWKLFSGILGLCFWRNPEKTSTIVIVAVFVLIFDASFLITSIFGFFPFGFIVAVESGLTFVLIILSFPAVIAYIVTASGLEIKVDTNPTPARNTKNNRFLNAIVFLGFVVVFTIFITTAVSLRNWFSERAAARDIPLSEIIPWGIWKSQNPPLLLYISPELQLESETLPGLEQYIFPAFYITENENIPMLVRFRTSVFNRNTPHSMTIFPLDDYEGISLTSTDFSRFDDNVLLVIIQHRIEVLFYRFIDYCYIYIKDDWPTPLSWNNSS